MKKISTASKYYGSRVKMSLWMRKSDWYPAIFIERVINIFTNKDQLDRVLWDYQKITGTQLEHKTYVKVNVMSSCSIFVSSSQNRFRHDSILNNKKIDQVLGSVGKTEEHRHKSSKQVKRCSFNTSFTVFVNEFSAMHIIWCNISGLISNVLSNKRNKTYAMMTAKVRKKGLGLSICKSVAKWY